ncbi:MAG: phosphatidylserine decarboxylase [Sedimentisphaerales bacterium]
MRMPITKYGLPQVVIYPGLTVLVMVIAAFAIPAGVLLCIFEAVLTAILIWLLSFFRDPKRDIPIGDNLILSPADGTISDIEEVEEPNFIGGKATRISIFLSIFNVHINRTPCAVRIGKITYHKGKFKNAMNPISGKVNESNDIAMVRLKEPKDKILVRQISGAIARRIVCDAKEGQEFAGGAVFGMLKFGSRTELYLPVNCGAEIIVRKGDKVKAGRTILAKYDGRAS